MLPTDILKNEHRVIEQVLNVLEKIAYRAGVENKFDIESAEEALDFFRNFADRCHHGKEEDQLFPLLESRGFSRETGPTGVMLHEHESGRQFIRGMADAIESARGRDKEAGDRFAGYARAYIDMLRMHINKEDHCLFAMTDKTLSAADQEHLMAQFDKVESEEMGDGTHCRYVDLANRLADRYGVDRVEAASGGHGRVGACSHHVH